MIPGFTRRQTSDTMSFAATSISKKNSIFVVKRLEILNIQPRFAVSPFLRSNHFLLWQLQGRSPPLLQQKMAPKHTWNKPYRGCKPPLSALFLKKFEISMVEDILSREFQKVYFAERSLNLRHSNFAGWFRRTC